VLPDFTDAIYQNGGELYQITLLAQYAKTGKIYQISAKVRNYHKICQMAIKYTTIFHSKAHEKLPKVGFGFENMPSGNPTDMT
jgi:hypothetical protein